MIDNDPSVKLW